MHEHNRIERAPTHTLTHTPTHTRTRPVLARARHPRLATLLAVALLAGGALAGSSPERAAAAVDDHDWLGAVNSYRMMSGLGPVSENPTWSAQGREHSHYMLLNGITHVQDPAKPGASEGGALAGSHGNVAVSSDVNATPRRYVDLWMSGPFHAIGLLRENLTSTGFGLASDNTTTPWRSGATLDVIRGITGSQPRTTAIVFPGRNATIAMSRFVAERPDPVELVGYSKPAGLPLLAMLPGGITTADASLVGPAGPVETRILHPRKSGGNVTAQQLMEGENAVVIVPRSPLEPGTYTASITSDGGNVTWSFTIDPSAPLPTPTFTAGPSSPPTDAVPSAPAAAAQPSGDTTTLSEPAGYVPLSPRRVADSRSGLGVVRLAAGEATTIDVGDAADVAASVNITVDRPSAPGYLSVHGASDVAPVVSTLNFTDRPSANHVVAPLTDGRLTLSASVDTDVIVDLNGVFRTDSSNRFVAVPPRRVVDSRIAGSVRLEPGTAQTVGLVGVPGAAPVGAIAVAVNLTMIEPSAAGYLTARPSGGHDAGVSSVNVLPGETRPNSALLTPGPDGAIVLESTVSTHVVIDVTGYVIAGDVGNRFAPVEPIRLFDSRMGGPDGLTGGHHIAGGTTVEIAVAGRRGVAADTRAVWVNVTAVDPSRAGYVTVHPGGPTPATSSLNTHPDRPAVANGVLVALRDGSMSLYADHDVHVMIDLTGVWS